MSNNTHQSIRPAASLLLLRDMPGTVSGVQVLAIRRSDNMRFLPGYLAFPGGAVDASDHHATNTQRLSVIASERPDDVIFARAALRECTEEIGICFGTTQLRFVGRWITPPNPQARFDTRFFAVDGRGVGDAFEVNATEIAWAKWSHPAELISAIETGQLQAVPPTRAMLLALTRQENVETAMRSLWVPGPA